MKEWNITKTYLRYFVLHDLRRNTLEDCILRLVANPGGVFWGAKVLPGEGRYIAESQSRSLLEVAFVHFI